MNTKILEKEVQDYICQKSNEKAEVTKLILSGSPFKYVTSQELAQQISGRIKAEFKLPNWYNTAKIYYPPSIHLEQTSSEQTANYKSKLISGRLLVDLTGGFGIDDFYFSKKIDTVIHCELNADLSEIARHNLKLLNANNIKTAIGDGLEIVKNLDHIDWLYIDPSRRNDSKGKVFFLEDCIPNVPENLDFLFNKSNQILIKTSPLLDISAGIKSLTHIEEIHVVAVHNEVKELLWILKKNTTSEIKIKAVNIIKEKEDIFSFLLTDESLTESLFSLPQQYLYEPNNAIMKSGGFSSIGSQYGLSKLHTNSHLYTASILIKFPGRIFEIKEVFPYSKKALSNAKIGKANITTRNFPNSVSEIRKKLKILEGGDTYLFFTTNYFNKKVIIHCRKIDPEK